MYSIQKQTKILFIFSLLLSMGTYLTSSTFFGFQFLLFFYFYMEKRYFSIGWRGENFERFSEMEENQLNGNQINN